MSAWWSGACHDGLKRRTCARIRIDFARIDLDGTSWRPASRVAISLRFMRTASSFSSHAIFLFVWLGAAACNQILGNQNGSSLEAETAADADAAADVESVLDSGPSTCEPGTKFCEDVCVAKSALNGCGSLESCAACSLPHAMPACDGAGTCVIATCTAGFANCDDQAPGCETDLSKATDCGQCSGQCQANAPYCAFVGEHFACTASCDPPATVCTGGDCVNLSTSINHCGICGTSCTAPTNATARCVSGRCDFQCDPGYHRACGGEARCEPDRVGSCGDSCVDCFPPGLDVGAQPTRASCIEGRCDLSCRGLRTNPDQDPANGCEGGPQLPGG